MAGDEQEGGVEDAPERPWTQRHPWLVRVGLGVLVAFGACAMVLPSYGVPAGSMMPTLEPGDHMLVFPWAYTFGGIERGDVIVFESPLDDPVLFTKRVIGLPGDQVWIRGRTVAIKRPGTQEFEALGRKKQEQPCLDPELEQPLTHCTVYAETVDGKTYGVRHKLGHEEERQQHPLDVEQVWTVPDGHLFVLGDNRNDSFDSRQWTVEVDGREEPAPFLPVDLVHGRAEWIWWPPSRIQAVR